MSEAIFPTTGTHNCAGSDKSWITDPHITKNATKIKVQVDLYGVTAGDNGIVLNIYESLTEDGLDADNITPTATITVTGGTVSPKQQIYTKDLSLNTGCIKIELDTSAGSVPVATLIINVRAI